jgi:DNA polymerase-3 subunit epsilon
MAFGVIVDVETTGLDPERDEIIEIGILGFQYSEDFDGSLPVISTIYGALEEPAAALTPTITALTGLEDKHLKGQKIDWDFAEDLLSSAQIVIAHNMPFDRSFLEQRPSIAKLNLNWACSLGHVDWRSLGFKTNALNYLAADHGFVNPFSHRAVFDCATTFKIVAPHLESLIKRSQMREYQIKAYGSPFETKDVLKNRAYRWDPEERVWGRTVSENELEEERIFLRDEIYRGPTKHEEVHIQGSGPTNH